MEIQEPPEEPLYFSSFVYYKKRFLCFFKFFQKILLNQIQSIQIKLNVIFLLLILSFFVSCSKELRDLNSSALKEAKYSDIPIPVGHAFIDLNNKNNDSTKQNSDYLFFVSNNSLKDNLDFYLKNMEIFGWDIDNFSVSQEALLVCNKTNRNCVISIRSNDDKKNKTRISIFIQKNMKNDDKDSFMQFSLKNEINSLEKVDKIKDINSKVLIEQII